MAGTVTQKRKIQAWGTVLFSGKEGNSVFPTDMHIVAVSLSQRKHKELFNDLQRQAASSTNDLLAFLHPMGLLPNLL